MFGNLVRKEFGEEVCGETSLNGQKCKDICAPWGCSPRVTSAEEDFNNQPGPCADDYQPFSQPPMSSPNGLVNKVFGGRDGGAV